MHLRILKNFFVCIVISVFILFPWNGQKAIGQSLPGRTVEAAPVPSENPEPTPVLKSEIEQIKSRGKIVIAMVNKDNAPFFSQNKDGKLVGLDVDLAESIAESLGIKAEFLRNSSTFDGVIENVYRGEADIAISKLARSLPRAQKVLFSNPYLNFRQALLLNRLSLAKSQSTGQTTDQVVKDFQGKIGVYAGSVYVQYASKTFPKATIVEFTNWEDAIDAVVSGQVTALFRDELEVRSVVLKKPELSIKLRTVVLTDTRDTKGIVTASGKHFLLDYTNLFLDTQYKQLDANHILNDYIN
jgi:polar amino acid transport system substrate-binding protein